MVATLLARRTCLLIDVPIAIEPRTSRDRPRVPGVLDHEVFAPFGPTILYHPPIGLAAGCGPESGARTGRRWRGGACLITRPSSAAGSVAPVKFSFQEVDSRRRHRCTGCQSRRRHPPDWRVAGGGHPPAGWMRPCLNGTVGITISTLTRSNPRQRRHRHVWRVARTDHAAQAGVFHPHTHCLFTRWYATHHPIGDVADRAGRPHYGSRCSGSAACVPSTSPACRTCATRAAQIWPSSAAVAVTK